MCWERGEPSFPVASVSLQLSLRPQLFLMQAAGPSSSLGGV